MALPEAGVSLIADGLSDYLSGIGKANAVSNDFFKSLDDGAKRTSSFSEIATGALRRVGEVAVNALGAATQAVGGFISDSIKVAGDFEASLQEFGAIAGDALAEVGYSFDDVSKKALQLGADTQYSAAESLLAMKELTKGGVEIEGVMNDVTDATLALATAGSVELVPAAEIVAKALAVWGKEGVTAAEVTDLITQAANASTVGVEDLASGLNNAQGRAKALGIEYKDFVTTMALIAPAFSSTEMAGTSYNNFLARLTFSTKEQKKVAKELGLITKDGTNVFFDATGAFVGNREAAILLAEAYKGLTAEDKLYIGNVLFGNDAMGAANALIEAGAEGYDKQAEAMSKAGSAMEQAKKRTEGFNFAMNALGGSVETLQVVIGGALLPVLTSLINDHVTPTINKFMEFSQEILNSENPIAALGQAIDTVLPGFSTFASTIASFTTSTIVPQLQGLADSISSVVGPAISDFAATIMPRLSESFENIKTGAGTVKSWIDDNWPGISTTLETELGRFQSYVNEKWTKLEPAITQTLANVQTWAQTEWAKITPHIQGALEAVISWVQENWPNLETQVTSIIDNIVQHATVELPRMSSALDPMTQAFGAWIADIQTKFAGFGEAVGKAIEAIVKFFEPVTKQFKAIGDEFGQYFDVTNAGGKENKTIWDQLGTTLGKVATALVSLGKVIGAIVLAIGVLLIPVARVLAETIGGLLPGAIMIFNGLLGGILGIINLVADAITLIVEVLGQLALAFVSGDFTQVQATFKTLMEAIVADIIQILGGAVLILIGLVRGLIGGITALFQSLWDALLAILEPLVLGIQKLFWDLYMYLIGGSVIPDLVNGIITWFSMLPSQLLAIIVQMVTSLISYITANLGIWMATLIQWGIAAWQWLATAIPQVIAQLAIWGATLLNYLTANLPTWIAQLLLWGNELWEFVMDAIPQLISQLAEFGSTLLMWATEVILPMLIRKATEWATSLYDWVTKELIPGILPKLAQFSTTMLARLTQMVKDFGKKAVEIGEAIIDGMINAIESGASAVVRAIIAMALAAIRAAMDVLDVGSPSKVFSYIGEMAMAGFAQGIKENDKEPSVAAIEAAKKTIHAVINAIKGIGGQGISEEITNVLDSWADTIDSLSDIFKDLEELEAFKKVNTPAFRQAVVNSVAGIISALREAANYISAQFKAYNKDQLDAMEVRGTVQELLDNWQNSISGISGMIDSLKNLFAFGKRRNLAEFMDNVRTGTAAVIDALRGAAQIVQTMMGNANLGMTPISDEIQAMLDNWGNLIQTIVDALANIKKLWSFGKSNTQGLKESVYDAVIKILEAMNAVRDAVNSQQIADNAANNLQSALNTSLQSASFQVEIPQVSAELGQNTGVSIVDGMESAIRKSGVRVADALVDVVTSAIEAAKKALGIASPSKVFFEVGTQTTKGLSLGIEEGAYQVVDVVTKTLGQMINAIPSMGKNGAMIAPPMSGRQIAQNTVINNTSQPNFTYAPQYNTAPPQTVDMAIAGAIASGFF